jgi:hypothetical protein
VNALPCTYDSDNMNILKVGADLFVNLDRMTFVEPARKGRLIVHFAVGGGDVGGPARHLKLDADEAAELRRQLEARTEAPPDR